MPPLYRVSDVRQTGRTGKVRANGWDKFHEYGLSFDYVEADTFDNQPKGYHRFQISWGGPSDELRFYSLDRVEYWYMDWFDGAYIGCYS